MYPRGERQELSNQPAREEWLSLNPIDLVGMRIDNLY